MKELTLVSLDIYIYIVYIWKSCHLLLYIDIFGTDPDH